MHRLLFSLVTILLPGTLIAAIGDINPFGSSNIGSTREIYLTSEKTETGLFMPDYKDPQQADEDVITPEEQEVHGLAAFIKEQSRYFDRIDSSMVMDLPAGIVSNNGILDYTIIVKKMVITPDSGAYLEVCMSFEIPQNGKKIAFVGKHIPFSFSGGIRGEARIELLGDKSIPLSENIRIILNDTGTYVAFDCNGFKSMGIDAGVEFSQNIFVPEKPDGTPDESKLLTTNFVTTIYDWNDLIVELSIPAFQVKGLKGVGFYINKAVFDFSDLNNASGIVFPQGYESSYFGGEGMSIKLWRGFYLHQGTIKLPKEFKKKDTPERLTFFASHLIIDENGLSGALGVAHLLNLGDGDMSSWAFSIDSLYLYLVANQLTEGGFNGIMNIPVFRENSALDYSAIVSTGGNYSFTVSCKKPLEMNMWAAQLVLQPTSSVTIAAVNGKFEPQADLTGTLSITNSNSSGGSDGEESNSVLAIGGISFEHMIIRTKTPYIEVGALSLGMGGTNDLGKFPITLKEIGFKSEESRTGISFTVDVNLMDSKDGGFSGGGGVIIWGKRDEISNKWKYDGVEVTKLYVDIDNGEAFKLKGQVIFFRKDSTYGKGFRGDLDATFNVIELQATALFGCVNSMRYWYADAMVNLQNGIPCGTFSIYGFGGGAYHHMRQQGFNENKGSVLGATRSGIVYIPTNEVSLGIKASIALGLAKKEVLNGDVTFEISFNRHGGINQVGFEGNAYFLTSEYTTQTSDVTANAKGMASGNDEPAKTTNADRAQISGSIKLLYDVSNKVFHGDIKIYANVAGGLVRGIGPQNLAGWAVIHFAPGEWYIHIGSPTNPVGLEIARILKTKSYFMVGTNIPGSPPPPAKVSEILGGVDLDYMRDLNKLGEGNGIAFGASVEINTGDITFLIFYARLEAGIGFDIMLKDYGDAYCEGRSGTIGINGWYANGQAYAYIEGSVGIKVSLPFYSGKYEILSIGVASVLQTKGPNPFWMRGIVGGRYSILNGLVKGNCKFEFTIGEECKLIAGNPLGGVKIISEITPGEGSTEVDVFNTPQVVFNMPVGKIMSIVAENDVTRTFRIKLEYFKIKDGSVEVPGTISWNDENDVAAYNNTDILSPQKKITAEVQVSFEELINSVWRVVTEKGQKAVENMTVSFVTGIAPDYIPLSNVEYSYPIINQYNFYKNEYSQGYIKLKKGQPYLFEPNSKFVQKIKFISDAGSPTVNFIYANTMITYNLPANLVNSKVYSFDLMNVPAQAAGAIDRNVDTVVTNMAKETDAGGELTVKTKEAEGTIETLQEKSLLAYYFRTSAYSTFTEKLNGMEVSIGWQRPLRINVDELGITFHGTEMFDKMETHWTDEIIPVVQFEAVFAETDWYNNTMKPILYNNYPLVSTATISWRDPAVIGVPPVKAAYIRQYPNNRMVTDEDISATGGEGTPDVSAIVYNVNHFTDYDFYDVRNKLASYYSTRPVTNNQVQNILGSMAPGMVKGNYPVNVKYVLPGTNTVTSTKRFNIENPF